MKSPSNHLYLMASALVFCIVINSFWSCSQKKEKQQEVTQNSTATQTQTTSDTPAQEIKPQISMSSNPMGDSLSRQTLTGKSVVIPQRTEPSRPKEPEIIVPLKPKICDINLKLIATPKSGQNIYYVTGLIPGEFKCWVDLENASIKICNGSPSVLYFVDTPNPKVTSTPPHFLDASTLATNGVGLFEYNGSNWVMRGASIWKRKDKGYGYYNTDNAGGG